jgi:hypothetical protein
MSPVSGRRRQDRVVLRSRSSLVIFAVFALVGAGLTIDAIVRGALVFVVAALPWIIAAVWAAYVVLARPCIILRPDGVTVINVLRRHDLPWSAVDHVTSRYQLAFRLRNGRRIVSWGAPTAGLDQASISGSVGPFRTQEAQEMRTSGVRSGIGRAPLSRPSVHTIIESARDRWEASESDSPMGDTPAAPRSTWEWWTVAVTAAIAIACIVAALV